MNGLILALCYLSVVVFIIGLASIITSRTYIGGIFGTTTTLVSIGMAAITYILIKCCTV